VSEFNPVVTTYANCKPYQRLRFANWIATLEPDLDNQGPKVLDLVSHNHTTFPSGGPFATWIFWSSDGEGILGTITFTPDDLDLGALGLIRFVQVNRGKRRLGLGGLMTRYALAQARDWLRKNPTPPGDETKICLSTWTSADNPMRIIAERLGFVDTGREWGDEHVFELILK
jgi:hypothetical protein